MAKPKTRRLAAILLALGWAGCGPRALRLPWADADAGAREGGNFGREADARTDGSNTPAVDARPREPVDGRSPSDGGVQRGGVDATADTQIRSDAGSDAKPLWRDSRDPFCEPPSDWPAVVDVWSDSRGVFALFADANGPTTVWANQGQGWRIDFSWPTGNAGRLRGFVNGPLAVTNVGACAIQLVDERGARCSSAATGTRDLAIVNDHLAYAVYGDRLFRYDGSMWTQMARLTAPHEVSTNGVWADESMVVVVGTAGLVYFVKPGESPVLQTGLPASDLRTVWAFGPNDVWVGSSMGELFHFDFKQWALATTLGGRDPSFERLWGASGTLFVLTRTTFGRWDGTGVTVLDTLNGNTNEHFTGLWGNSPQEVFFSLMDPKHTSSTCGLPGLRWFDGSVVRPL